MYICTYVHTDSFMYVDMNVWPGIVCSTVHARVYTYKYYKIFSIVSMYVRMYVRVCTLYHIRTYICRRKFSRNFIFTNFANESAFAKIQSRIFDIRYIECLSKLQ